MADDNETEKLRTADFTATEKLDVEVAPTTHAPGSTDPTAGSTAARRVELTARLPVGSAGGERTAGSDEDETGDGRPAGAGSDESGEAGKLADARDRAAREGDEADAREEGPEEDPDEEEREGRGRQRRRRRPWRIAVVVLLVLAVALAGAAVAAERYVRSQVTETILQALPGLSDDASVTIEGLILPQVLDGRLGSLTVDADSLVIETGSADVETGIGAISSVELTDLQVTLEGLETASPHTVGSVEVTASLGFEELRSLVAAAEPDFPGVTITPQTYGSQSSPGTMSAQASVLTMEASLTVEPQVTEDGGLKLTMTTVTIQGAEFDLEAEIFGRTVLQHLGMDSPDMTISADMLPAGLTITRAYVARDGLRLTLAGTDIDLGSM